jgi:hypothetical protein
MEFANNPALKVFIGSPTNCMISSTWDQIQGFVRQFGPEAAENLAKQLGSSGAAAVRHAISTFESAGPSPWTMKAAENVRLTPREFQTFHSVVFQNLRAAAGNTNVQKAAVGTSATTTAVMGVATLLKMPVGAAFSLAPLTSVALVGGAGLVGYGLGTLADHAVGWIRDDGRTLSDLLSNSNQGVPVQDPTGHGAEGWRFVPDQK